MRLSEYTDYFRLVECFDPPTNACTLTPSCRLRHVCDDALKGYFKALDSATLADVGMGPPAALAPAVGRATVRRSASTVAPPASRRPAQPLREPARNL